MYRVNLTSVDTDKYKKNIRFGNYSLHLNVNSAQITYYLKCKLGTYLANPTPLLTPLASLKILVEITCPNGFNMFSSSCSSIEIGKFEMYKFVGSCSCCYKGKQKTVGKNTIMFFKYSFSVVECYFILIIKTDSKILVLLLPITFV